MLKLRKKICVDMCILCIVGFSIICDIMISFDAENLNGSTHYEHIFDKQVLVYSFTQRSNQLIHNSI